MTDINELFEKYFDNDDVSSDSWCEICQHSHLFLMDGIGLCRKKNDELVYYCGTCDMFLLDKEKQKRLRKLDCN